jgi:exodeoxyribonuclease V alpha subunit
MSVSATESLAALKAFHTVCGKNDVLKADRHRKTLFGHVGWRQLVSILHKHGTGTTAQRYLTDAILTSPVPRTTISSIIRCLHASETRQKFQHVANLIELSVPPAMAMRLCEETADDCDPVEKVMHDPYDALPSTRVADDVAVHLRWDPGSLRRIQGHAMHILKDAANAGHDGLLLNAAVQKVRFSTGLSESVIQEAFETILENDDQDLMKIHCRNLQYMISRRVHANVLYIAQTIRSRIDTCHFLPSTISTLMDALRKEEHLTSVQLQAVENALQHGFSVITGGPGTGKSATIRALVNAFERYAPHHKLLMMAPTGKAARNVDGKTVHYHRIIQEVSKREVREEYGDALSLVIVDEASMVTTHLMLMVFGIVPKHCHVVLVGDPDQLPPIGQGTILADLCALSTCPIVRLVQNHRTSNASILNMSRAILDKSHLLNDVVRKRSSKDLASLMTSPFSEDEPITFVEVENKAQCVDVILKSFIPSALVLSPRNTMRKLLNRALQLASHPRVPVQGGNLSLTYDTKPNSDVLMMDSTNTRTLQRFSNVLEALEKTTPAFPRSDGRSLQLMENDPVMITKNQAELAACNGDVGVVTKLSSTLDAVVVTMDRDNTVHVIAHDECTLGYVTTVHKAQGSEADVVILPLYDHTSWDPALLYTALTRAKWRVILIGSSVDVLETIVHDSYRPPKWSLFYSLFQ